MLKIYLITITLYESMSLQHPYFLRGYEKNSEAELQRMAKLPSDFETFKSHGHSILSNMPTVGQKQWILLRAW